MTQTTAVAPAQEPAFESDSLHIPDSDRRGWWSIACIWIGNSINVSTLMTGAVLGAGLTLWDAFWAAFIGFGIILAYMCFVAMEATDTGLPTSAMSTAALGRKGGRYIISIILGVSLIGWFGVQAAVCGSSFSLMVGKLGLDVSPQICSIVLGALMLVTAILGFDGVKWVNYIAAPLLFIICAYGLFASLSNTGMGTLTSYVPKESMGLVAGINIAVGFFAVGGATVGDFTRYARDRKGAVLSTHGHPAYDGCDALRRQARIGRRYFPDHGIHGSCRSRFDCSCAIHVVRQRGQRLLCRTRFRRHRRQGR